VTATRFAFEFEVWVVPPLVLVYLREQQLKLAGQGQTKDLRSIKDSCGLWSKRVANFSRGFLSNPNVGDNEQSRGNDAER
jgi:hypothetical protein